MSHGHTLQDTELHVVLGSDENVNERLTITIRWRPAVARTTVRILLVSSIVTSAITSIVVGTADMIIYKVLKQCYT